MRPRRARLGCAAARSRRQHLHEPSMRPRRARLGCFVLLRLAEARRLASMRPRRARLGCLVEVTGACFPCGCFNEAEARAPRMRRAEIERCRRSPGFNEAEARAPRMQAPGGKLMTAPATASMRPRRARLGCSPSKYRLSAKSQSFNEAEARAPRMHQELTKNWGFLGASMRPRRARLGCVVVHGCAPTRLSRLQ